MNVFKDKATFKNVYKNRVESLYAKPFSDSNLREKYHALGSLVSEEISQSWMKTKEKHTELEPKTVHYFSMEFLIGRLITNNISNLGIRDIVEEGLKELDINLDELEHQEVDPGLGNGGLGRLAACFLDSLASLGLPGYGNGIRYRYGLFEQQIKDGYQIEKPDDWLKESYVWEVRRESDAIDIPFGGETYYNNGVVTHTPNEYIKAVPYDVPVVGEGNNIVTHLRLWNAEPTGTYPEHIHAFEYDKEIRELSGFLYPDDTTDEGKILRIKQQYFFSSAGVRSILNKHFETYKTFDNVPDKLVFQINDTHPSLIIPEMMRIFLDEHNMTWDNAWAITNKTCAYTNHTILAEALEKWPIYLLKPVLPRVYQIIEEIDRRYVDMLKKETNNDHQKVSRMAIISDGKIHMAHLAIVGSFSVNGVADLHTKIIKNIEMKEFHELYPNKFNNKTNGITHRRWLKHVNKELSSILDDVSDDWLKKPENLIALKPFHDDPKMQKRVASMKRAKKVALAERIKAEQGIELDVDGIFDVQVKRMHEYKRQLMNALHIMMVYNRLKTDKAFKENYVPHSFIFGAKAASGYHYAKKIIKFINTIADKVNNDTDVNKHLKVVFVENYNVTYGELIFPACDLSEQISMATKEASGTGNMKFMMNGAITIGTMDGANVEIADRVGEENIVIFGLTSDEVNDLKAKNTYDANTVYHSNQEIKTVVDQLTNGFFENVDINEFTEIKEKLLGRDEYLVLKDLAPYQKAHEIANDYYQDQSKWWSMAIINIAESGYFSSDRTISQYADDIWKIKPIK